MRGSFLHVAVGMAEQRGAALVSAAQPRFHKIAAKKKNEATAFGYPRARVFAGLVGLWLSATGADVIGGQ